MTTDVVPGSRLTAAKALAAVVALLVLSLVLPPAVATWVADARLERARVETAALAEALRTGATNGGQFGSAVVLAGSGRLPKATSPATHAWLSASRGSLTAQPDPWGNAYLVLLGRMHTDSATASADRVLAMYVLSAGPNGAIETPFDPAANDAGIVSFGGGGDDVWVRVPLPE
ncbi:MAG: hypothetical protein AABY89_08795 [Acidobacteriota bacterium]